MLSLNKNLQETVRLGPLFLKVYVNEYKNCE